MKDVLISIPIYKSASALILTCIPTDTNDPVCQFYKDPIQNSVMGRARVLYEIMLMSGTLFLATNTAES